MRKLFALSLVALSLILPPVMPLHADALRDSSPALAKGRLVVASEESNDPNFAGSVVLIIAYSAQGAAGLIINRPSPVTLSETLPGIDGLLHSSERAYLGGPVARGQSFVLIRSAQPLENAKRVFDDVYVSTDRPLLEKLLADPSAAGSFRVYIGYAGWAPKQLDHELARGGWQVVSADAESIFNDKPEAVWEKLHQANRGQMVRAGGGRGHPFPLERLPISLLQLPL